MDAPEGISADAESDQIIFYNNGDAEDVQGAVDFLVPVPPPDENRTHPIEVNYDNSASGGVVRRKMTFRGGKEGLPDGTLELEVHRAGSSDAQ